MGHRVKQVVLIYDFFFLEKIKSRRQKGEGKNERNISPLIWPIYRNLVHIISITTDFPKVWTRMKYFFFPRFNVSSYVSKNDTRGSTIFTRE